MLKKNDIIPATITDITSEACGISRHDDYVIMTPFAAIGDELNLRILKAKERYAYAKIEQIVVPSADRIPACCAAFGKCGGCDFRHISYSAELSAKKKIVQAAFSKAGFVNVTIDDVLPSENVDFYRNKAQFPVSRDTDGKICWGFFRSHSHDVVKSHDCRITPPDFAKISDIIVEYCAGKHISPYNEAAKNGVLRHIYIRKGERSGETIVVLVTRRRCPEFLPLARELMACFPDIKGVLQNVNPKDTNVILGENTFIIAGREYFNDTICGINVRISPKTFYQVNTRQAEHLYNISKGFAEPKDRHVLDLYCGAGLIGLSMAREAASVTGVDIVPEAIANARDIAAENGITNANFIAGDMADARVFDQLTQVQPDIIVLDPARNGVSGAGIDAVLKLSPAKIVMISCNPATAARDCKLMETGNYRLRSVSPVDMFPRTRHVELAALLERAQ